MKTIFIIGAHDIGVGLIAAEVMTRHPDLEIVHIRPEEVRERGINIQQIIDQEQSIPIRNYHMDLPPMIQQPVFIKKPHHSDKPWYAKFDKRKRKK